MARTQAGLLNRRSMTFLLLLAVPVWGYGLHESLKVRHLLTERSCHDAGIFARYEALEPHLAPDASVLLWVTSKEQGRLQFFRAQYTLAPRVLRGFFRISAITGAGLENATLILDFEEPSGLMDALGWIRSQARKQGFSVSELEIDGLVLVKVAAR